MNFIKKAANKINVKYAIIAMSFAGLGLFCSTVAAEAAKKIVKKE